MEKKPLTLPCPSCGKLLAWDPQNAFRPFCSERCKLIDLGAWADESHKIPGEPLKPDDPETDEEQ